MKIVYLGSGEFGVECLNELARSDQSVQFVVTQPPHRAGRGRKPRPTSVARWANTHSLPFTETENTNAAPVIEQIAGHQPDLLVVIAFGQKVGTQLIDLPGPGRAINVHASLLPKYRGAAPINWAIIKGESQTGISIITLAEKMDTGKILAQSQTEIAPDETAGDLHDRLARMAAPLLLKTLKQIENGTATYTEQDHSKATLAPKLRKSDGFLDLSEPADLLARKIRGFWPWPGASADYVSQKTSKSTRVTFAMAKVIETPNPGCLPAGTLDKNLNVICGQNALEITKIKPDGSRLMDFKDFVNGRDTQPGDTFVKTHS